MMLYLTGADSSTTTGTVTQKDASKSLGGYISSTPVPNGALNTLFDEISMLTIKNSLTETICIGLVNKLDTAVTNVALKIIIPEDAICTFKVGAELADDDLQVQSINNRYEIPLDVTFYDATFERASVDVTIVTPAIAGEAITFDSPIDVIAEIEEAGYDGTWAAIETAFKDNTDYTVQRLTETTFRITVASLDILDQVITYSATDSCVLAFSGNLCNSSTGEAVLVEDGIKLEAGAGIGIWLQRNISSVTKKSYRQLIDEYNKRQTENESTEETIELYITYDQIYEDTTDNVVDSDDTNDDVDVEDTTPNLTLTLSPTVVFSNVETEVQATAVFSETADSITIYDSDDKVIETGTSCQSVTCTSNYTLTTDTIFNAAAVYNDTTYKTTQILSVRNPVYYGFGTTYSDVFTAAVTLDPTTTAVGEYTATNDSDGQYFFICVPADVIQPTTFTIGDVDVLMEDVITVNIIVNDTEVEYYIYQTSSIFDSDTTITIKAE